MMPGNRYAGATAPQAAPGAPQAPPPSGPAAPDPALAQAFTALSDHDGSFADLLKDPVKLKHLRTVFETVKRNPAAQQQLAAQGLGPDKLQQFEQLLTQASQSSQARPPAPAPHWLAS